MRAIIVAALLGALAGCATLQPSSGTDCRRGGVRLLADAPQARAGSCERTGPASFVVTIAPEARPINPSPWYAFEIVSDHARTVRVTLEYAEHRHRYRPKREDEAGQWTPLPASAVSLSEAGRTADITFDVGSGRTRLAAQEWLDPAERQAWIEAFAARAGLTRAVIGRTVQGRPLIALRGGSTSPGAPLVIITGGQHPPEVPGVLALRAFLETLFLATEPADAFLDSHAFLIVPEMNLDGVALGHWRLNAGLVDLNRDWGPFTQPETRAVSGEISRLAGAGHRPALMLDFHATRRNVFYTPPDGAGLQPPGFTASWLAAIDARWEGELPARSANHTPGLPTSRTWFTETYGAPGLTVEFSDETPRDDLRAAAQTYARALMEVMAAGRAAKRAQ